jgi:8-oxo-dGTP pyrophosphatase MutT (NUDIX family)
VAGPAAPWLALPPEQRHISVDRVRERLSGRVPRGAVLEPFPIRRSAAVLVPIYDDRDEAHVVLTRRPWEMRSHSGEVSFPGGGQDPSDADLVATALREAWEEVALPPDRVEVIGQLDPLATLTSGAHITPFVGILDGADGLVPAADEVAAILHVPLRELLEDGVYHEERWPWAAGMEPGYPTPDGLRPMHFFDLPGDTVWGATARMLFQLLLIATGAED